MRIFAGHYPSISAMGGYVWVYMNSRDRKAVDKSAGNAISGNSTWRHPGLPVFSKKYNITHLECELPSLWTQGLLGLLDPRMGRLCIKLGSGGASTYSREAETV